VTEIPPVVREGVLRLFRDIVRRAVARQHIVQWEPQSGGYYVLCCQVCGETFGESYAPGGFDLFRLEGSTCPVLAARQEEG
jgi:hypothetical protein